MIAYGIRRVYYESWLKSMVGLLADRSENVVMPATVAIGRLRFDVDGLALYDGREIVPLPPLPARMLSELIRANGDIVSATWMRSVLWGDAAIEDRNLNQQMYVLRRVLRREARIAIENVPRRGYRLVVAPAVSAPRPRRPRFLWGAGAVAALVALFVVWFPRPQSEALPVGRELAIGNYLATSEGPHHLDRAADVYRALILRAPASSAGYGGLALVNARQAVALNCSDARSEHFATAQAEAGAALQRNPDDANALTALGIVASVRDHRMEIARRMFDQAVVADPIAESPRAWRAMFLLSIGEFKEAGQDFQAISEEEPTSAWAVGLFGEWLVLDRKYAQANSVLSQALDLGNHPSFTRYWLARSYYLSGRESEALRLANEVLALNPGEPMALALRVQVEAKLGDPKAALLDFERIERIEDPNQMDPIALASADVALGRRGQALRALRQYESSGLPGLDDVARIRTDPDFDSLRSGFNTPVTL